MNTQVTIEQQNNSQRNVGLKLAYLIHSRAVDNGFLTYILNYDLVFLIEIRLSGKDAMYFDIYGYICEQIYGNKTRNISRGRLSGGITFYYKKELKPYIKVVQKEQFGIMFVKISSELFPFD